MSKLKQITLILENLEELEVPVKYLKTLELDHVKESHHLKLADDEIGKLYEVASLKVAIDSDVWHTRYFSNGKDRTKLK